MMDMYFSSLGYVVPVLVVISSALVLKVFLNAFVYNIFLHPLRKYPGPKIWAMSNIPYIKMIMSGRPHERLLKLHANYGDIIRIAPNELSFVNPEAWREIMGSHPDREENNKDPLLVDPESGSMISAPIKEHARMRKILSAGFSNQSLLTQQPVISRHVDLLINRLHAECKAGTKLVDMAEWYHFALFDIVSDLTFGKPFGCLENARLDPWVTFIFSRVKIGAFFRTLLRLPGAAILLKLFVPRKAMREANDHHQQTKKKVLRRLALGKSRADFLGFMLSGRGELKLKEHEMVMNAEVLIIGGSETTASALCAATYLLAAHPEAKDKVVSEILKSFPSEKDIIMGSTGKLPYLTAVINEALRLYPPAPTALPRRTPPKGNLICGEFVPENTILGIWQWTVNHSAKNFENPFHFIPERWLDKSRFARDRRDAFQPFSYGPRSCLGQNLAMAEIYYILTRMLWSFDFVLSSKSKDWLNQDVFILWQKVPLKVFLIPRK